MADDIYQYRYITEVEIILPSETIKPLKILKIQDRNLYHDDFFATMEMDIQVSRPDSIKINKNQLTAIFHIKRTEYKYKSTEGDSNGKGLEKVSQNKILDEQFVPLFDPKLFAPNLKEEDFENDKNVDSEGKSTRLIDTLPITLNAVLYSIPALKANKDSLINAVFKKCTPGTALGWIVENSPIESAIVDKPDNEMEENFLVLLPYNLRNSLHWLQLQYGLYNDGLIAFLDYNRLYVLSKFGKSHDYEAGDKPYNYLIIHDPAASSYSPARIKETSDSFEYTCSLNANLIDIKALAGEMQGSKTITTNMQMAIDAIKTQDGNVVGYSNAARAIKRQVKSHEKTGDKVIFEYDEMNNLTAQAAYNRERSPKDALSLGIPGVCVGSFKPNKIFNLEFTVQRKQQELGGKYTPIRVYVEYSLVTSTSDEMIANAQVILMSLKGE